MYRLNDQKCRKFIRKMGTYIIFHLFTFVAPLIHAIVSILSGNYDVSTFNLPFNLVVPFNTQTIFGWCFEWFIQLNTGLSYALCMITSTTYFVCFSLDIVAMCEHFNLICCDVDRMRSRVNHQKLWGNVPIKFRHAIEIHAKLFA